MNFTFGTITNALRSVKLSSEWEKKKEEAQTKKQNDMIAKMTEQERMIYDLKKQSEDNEKAGKLTAIEGKLMAGKELTPEEEEYLKENDPDALLEYKKLQVEKANYKEKLKHCKTKEDVDRLKMNSLSGAFTECRRISTNPNIPKEKKVILLKRLQMKVNFDKIAQEEFVADGSYHALKTDQEVLDEAREKIEELTPDTNEENKEIENLEEELELLDDTNITQDDNKDEDIKDTIKEIEINDDTNKIHKIDTTKEKIKVEQHLETKNIEPKDITFENVKLEINVAINEVSLRKEK